MARILVIDDDINLALMISQWLKSFEHLQCDTVHTCEEADALLRSTQFDAIVLDWQLPDGDGVELLLKFRSESGDTPVLMLTGRAAVKDKENGLDAGADDYLTKPFEMAELAVRVQALLRRAHRGQSSVLRCGDVILHHEKYSATRGTLEIQLVPREFALLRFFMQHPNETFSAEALLRRVWLLEPEVTSDALRTCIKRLRQKLGADIILNQRGNGYVFARREIS